MPKNPKSKARPRRNGSEAEGARAMAEAFHQRPSTKVYEYEELREERTELAGLGKLELLTLRTQNRETFDLTPAGVKVTCTADGGQIYFVGGDQAIDPEALGLQDSMPKDHLCLGACTWIHYYTKKGFHHFESTIYKHRFGEEGGSPPLLNYDVRNQTLYLTGGTYQVRSEGIVN
jgi:hypothetical protein